MAKAITFPGLTEDKFCELQEKAKTKREFQRIQCLYLRKQGYSAKDISRILSVGTATVTRVHIAYRDDGELAIFEDKRGGRYNENMTEKEERSFIRPFLKKAKTGSVLIVNDIHKAYEKKLGRKIPLSTIYLILHRNGWRKIVPRPSHPKKDIFAQEAFKASFPPKGVSGKTGS